MTSLTSTPSPSIPSIPDPATDMPTVWVPLSLGETERDGVQSARKRDLGRLIAIILFFAGGISLLALLIILQVSRF